MSATPQSGPYRGHAVAKYSAEVREYQLELARRSRSVIRQRTLDGWWLGPAPYGYSLEHHWVEAEPGRAGWRHRLTVDKVRAPVVPLIFSWYLQDKFRERDIVRILIEQQHPQPVEPVSGRARAWSPAVVRTILTNPAYLGYVVRNRTQCGADRPPESWTWSRSQCHEALVGRDMFWSVYGSRYQWGGEDRRCA